MTPKTNKQLLFELITGLSVALGLAIGVHFFYNLREIKYFEYQQLAEFKTRFPDLDLTEAMADGKITNLEWSGLQDQAEALRQKHNSLNELKKTLVP